jgi:GTP-binding protein
MDFGGSPEVCFLGRSNVGKSSLLNALLKKEIAHASARRGRTRMMNAFAVGGIGGPEEVPSGTEEKGLVVMDMPGYGHGAHAEWGKEIMKYLDKRKQLKRAFVLIDAEHEFKASDEKTIRMLQELQVPFQVVLSKVDRILFGKNGKKFPSGELLQKKLGRVHETALKAKGLVMPSAEDEGRGIGEVIAVCSQNPIDGKPIGIDQLRFAVLRAAGLELQQKSTGSRVVVDETVPYEGDVVHMPALRKAERVLDEDIVPFEEIPELYTPESGESERVEQQGKPSKK